MDVDRARTVVCSDLRGRPCRLCYSGRRSACRLVAAHSLSSVKPSRLDNSTKESCPVRTVRKLRPRNGQRPGRTREARRRPPARRWLARRSMDCLACQRTAICARRWAAPSRASASEWPDDGWLGDRCTRRCSHPQMQQHGLDGRESSRRSENYDRTPMTDGEIVKVIEEFFATNLIYRQRAHCGLVRDCGIACEQKRFGALFRRGRLAAMTDDQRNASSSVARFDRAERAHTSVPVRPSGRGGRPRRRRGTDLPRRSR